MTTYAYEALSAEAFQMLVQALLTREFSDIQCFPVGMPDGGRDAVNMDLRSRQEIFQVKQARDPVKIDDLYKWLTAAVDRERPKINRLVERGYQSYRLVTNVVGSSHLDTGLRDRVQRYLDESLPIPAKCWWRDDLDRRLDSSFDLKLRYPDLLNGPDVVRLLWEYGDSVSDTLRRKRVFEKYMQDRYDEDHTVRFKQIDLESTELFDLFIDVPVAPLVDRTDTEKSSAFSSAYHGILNFHAPHGTNVDADENYYLGPDRWAVGGANLLTDTQFLDEVRYLVIEGTPGQGKTTLSQYLVQIQRARLLERKEDIAKLPANHASSPIMLPIKIELRDLALWLRGFDPWDSAPGSTHGRRKTLESALAAHIEHFSGGAEFSVSDLQETVRITPTIILLDALDEVADLADRKAVVSEILTAINRLEQGNRNLKVIVTSRPSAVTGAPTLPKSRFMHLRLGAISRAIALKYCDRWAKARRLKESIRKNVRDTLRDKLGSPHLADLARNTMQLSILLNLIYARGASLPDKRTEMYDEYVNLFFSREAEKSEIVRDNRVLLIQIHRYLAYYLHSRAESKRATGRISENELRQLLRGYLRETHADESSGLIDDLFTGLTERVVALVSRIEGTYEFEVQPLREYFAAKYLYETAPYSPPGREASGTKPVRFEGLAPNPYWLNVTRFFAGCFSDGELLDLAERVYDLSHDEGKYRSYPRRLAVALLQDLVFSQSKRAADRVALTLRDTFGLKWISMEIGPPGTRTVSDPVLPLSAGGKELGQTAWGELLEATHPEKIRELAGVVAKHTPQHELLTMWRNNYDRSHINSFSLVSELRIMSVVEEKDVVRVLQAAASRNASHVSMELVEYAYSAGDESLVPDEFKSVWAQAILENGNKILPRFGPRIDFRDSEANLFWQMTNTVAWLSALQTGVLYPYRRRMEPNDQLPNNPHLRKMAEWNRAALSTDQGDFAYSMDQGDFAHTLAPWQQVIDSLEKTFGPTWATIELAAISAAIRSRSERGKRATCLLEPNAPLTARVRYARRQSGNADWWIKQAASMQSPIDAALYAVVASLWTSGETFTQLLPYIDNAVAMLPPHYLENLLNITERVLNIFVSKIRGRQVADIHLPSMTRLRPSTRCLLTIRLNGDSRQLYGPILLSDWEIGGCTARYRAKILAESLRNDASLTPSVRTLIKSLHKLSEISHAFINSELTDQLLRKQDNVSVWREILDQPWQWPTALTAVAQTAIDRAVHQAVAVRDIAKRDKWFESTNALR